MSLELPRPVKALLAFLAAYALPGGLASAPSLLNPPVLAAETERFYVVWAPQKRMMPKILYVPPEATPKRVARAA